MPSTYESLWNELIARLPSLDPAYAPKLIQRAWSDVRNSRPWSFLIGNGVLFSPVVITAGAVAVTQFNAAVTFDATARAALNGVSNPVLTFRQFRVGGPIYSIVGLDVNFAANGIATLDRPYLEATNAAAGYQVYRCYYGAPSVTVTAVDGTQTTTETTDFLRYRAIYNPSTLQRFRLYGTVEELNILDPKRVTSGNPWALYTHSAAAGAFYEMYPHPLAAQSYIATYQKRGTDLAAGESLPVVIPDELILERAYGFACIWAESAKGRIKELQGPNWLQLAAAANGVYQDRLREASLRDEDLLRQNGVFDDLPFGGYGNWPFNYNAIGPSGQVLIW
jgi:hypothetical protein